MGAQGVSQCFGCGVVCEGEEDIDDGNFYCFACWLIYHTARAQLRQNTTHVHPARNLQGVSYTPGSAQHERSVEDVSLTLGRRPQLQRPGACAEHCTVQNTSFVFEQRAKRAYTQITTKTAHAHDLEVEFTQVGGWDTSSDSDEGDSAMEGSDQGDRVVEGSDQGDSAVEGVTKVTALWRGVMNTSTRASMLMASMKRSVLQTARMGPVRRWMRASEKVATVRRGVISRRRRVMRKVARMRKRVTRRCGMRCRKPYQRWGMRSTTRPFFAQGLKRRDPLHIHHPGRQCGLRMCLVYLYLFVSCVQLRLSSDDFQW